MPKSKEEKKQILKRIEEEIKKQKITIFFDYSHLKTKDIWELKKKLKEVKANFFVCKKTLLKKVLEKEKINIDEKMTEGQLALVLGYEDEIGPAKVLYQFEKGKNKEKILGGILGYEPVSKDKIISLAKLPSYQELVAQFLYTLSAPVSNFVSVLENNLKGLIYVLNQIKQAKENT